MSDKDKGDEIRYWWSQSVDSLQSAKQETKFGAYFFALNRVYYSAFYATSALLQEKGGVLGNHQAIQEALNDNLIAGGELEAKWGEFYDKLLADFLERDDQKLDNYDRSFIEEQIQTCEEYLKVIQPMIKAIQI